MNQDYNENRKDRYNNDPEYREKVKAANRAAGQARRDAGIKQKRKPLTEEQKQKGREAKARYKAKHPEKVKASSRKTRQKMYAGRKDEFKIKNAEARKTLGNQYSSLKSATTRRTLKGSDKLIELHFSFEEFCELRQKPCHYCKKKLPDTGTCMDRKDCCQHYTTENTVPCCHECNEIKHDELTEEEMLAVAAALNKFRLDNELPVVKIVLAMSKSSGNPISVKKRFSLLRLHAEARGIAVEFTLESYAKFIAHPCLYCSGPISDYGYGLDRDENSARVYSFINCVPCCGVCNKIKGKRLSLEEAVVAVNAVQKVRLGLRPPSRFDFPG